MTHSAYHHLPSFNILMRYCFTTWTILNLQVELAKWFYDDEYVNTDASLTSCSMRDFCEHIFRRVPFLT